MGKRKILWITFAQPQIVLRFDHVDANRVWGFRLQILVSGRRASGPDFCDQRARPNAGDCPEWAPGPKRVNITASWLFFPPRLRG